MTRKDFVALAEILRAHNLELSLAEVEKKSTRVVFDSLVADIRKFCKERNPNFNVSKFDDAVYWKDSDDA